MPAPQPVELVQGETPVGLHAYLVETAEWQKADVLIWLGLGVGILTVLVVVCVVLAYGAKGR